MGRVSDIIAELNRRKHKKNKLSRSNPQRFRRDFEHTAAKGQERDSDSNNSVELVAEVPKCVKKGPTITICSDDADMPEEVHEGKKNEGAKEIQSVLDDDAKKVAGLDDSSGDSTDSITRPKGRILGAKAYEAYRKVMKSSSESDSDKPDDDSASVIFDDFRVAPNTIAKRVKNKNQNSRYNQKELYLKALDKVWQEIPERFAPEDSNRRFNFKVAVPHLKRLRAMRTVHFQAQEEQRRRREATNREIGVFPDQVKIEPDFAEAGPSTEGDIDDLTFDLRMLHWKDPDDWGDRDFQPEDSVIAEPGTPQYRGTFITDTGNDASNESSEDSDPPSPSGRVISMSLYDTDSDVPVPPRTSTPRTAPPTPEASQAEYDQVYSDGANRSCLQGSCMCGRCSSGGLPSSGPLANIDGNDSPPSMGDSSVVELVSNGSDEENIANGSNNLLDPIPGTSRRSPERQGAIRRREEKKLEKSRHIRNKASRKRLFDASRGNDLSPRSLAAANQESQIPATQNIFNSPPSKQRASTHELLNSCQDLPESPDLFDGSFEVGEASQESSSGVPSDTSSEPARAWPTRAYDYCDSSSQPSQDGDAGHDNSDWDDIDDSDEEDQDMDGISSANLRGGPRRVAHRRRVGGFDPIDETPMNYYTDEDPNEVYYVDEAPEAEREPNHLDPDNCVAMDFSGVHTDPSRAFRWLFVRGARKHARKSYQRDAWSLVQRLFKLQKVKGAKSYDTEQRLLHAGLPALMIHYKVQNKETGEVVDGQADSFPRKRFPARLWRQLVVETRVDFGALLKFFVKNHRGARKLQLKAQLDAGTLPITFFVDGVQPSNSGTRKMYCQAVRIGDCHSLLNVNTIVVDKSYSLSAEEMMAGFIKMLRTTIVDLKLIVADMPQRLQITGSQSFNGRNGCNVCVAEAETKQGGVNWPLITVDKPLRDHKSFQTLGEAADDLACGPVLGAKTTSPLLQIPHFDIAEQVAIDCMHLIAGLTKSMWYAFLDECLTEGQRIKVAASVSDAYTSLNMPASMKRCTRGIDPRFKANEWKQLLLLSGLDIAAAYDEVGHEAIGLFWRRFVFIVRAMAQPDAWWNGAKVDDDTFGAMVNMMYSDVQEILGREFCSPNLHAFSHLPMWRNKLRMHKMSAEIGEDHWGHNRAAFGEQSHSIGKQIDRQGLFRFMDGHSCVYGFNVGPRTNDTSMNHIVVDRKMNIYYVDKVMADNDLLCRRVLCTKFKSANNNYNWASVGVFKVAGVGDVNQYLNPLDVAGLGIIKKDRTLLTWTRDMQEF